MGLVSADDVVMAEDHINLADEQDPLHPEWLLRLRAFVATDIANGRRPELVFEDLVDAATRRIERCSAAIITLRTDDDLPRVRASSAPAAINALIHGVDRRRWFGAWSAAISRQTEMVISEISASSLYREHRRTFIDHNIQAARATPLFGRHNIVGGVMTVMLQEPRILTGDEVEAFEEIADLAALALRREQEREEMLYQLRHDILTGLENREGLEDRLRAALNSSPIDGPGVGLLFIDIDDLTLVNDSLGHTAGDRIIATTAGRIQNQLMRADHVVRFGGDEFIVILERIGTLQDARSVAERIRDAIGEPIEIDGSTLVTTVSIGIAIGGLGTEPLELIDHGHAAVVRAKQNGRGSTAEHDQALDAGASERLDREQDLRTALENGEFAIFWQPKVDLRMGKIIGAEALVRWIDPDKGVLGPDFFIPTAERAGLIDDLSDWVLRQAVSEAVELTKHIEGFSAAINLSATQIARPDMDFIIGSALDSNGLEPGSLIVELTESILADDLVIKRLGKLRDYGVKLAIDDFGTGYSSLSYVRNLPVGIVKIDRAFLVGLQSDGTGAPVLTAAVKMAHSLGKSTTVEGVETLEQLAGLRALEVEWGQGYLFAEPTPLATLIAQIEGDPTF